MFDNPTTPATPPKSATPAADSDMARRCESEHIAVIPPVADVEKQEGRVAEWGFIGEYDGGRSKSLADTASGFGL